MKYKAFLFDLNGTMINDMHYHINAWHTILNKLGAQLSLTEVEKECYGKNGELLERVFPERFTDEEKNTIGYEKELAYQKEYKPHLALLPGLQTFINHYHAKGIRMAIGSAAIMFNINFVLDTLNIRHYFNAIVSADNVIYSKPHPETYTKAAILLGIPAQQCIVFEDNPKGVEAAIRAEMPAVVITTMHTPANFAEYKNVLMFSSNFINMSFD